MRERGLITQNVVLHGARLCSAMLLVASLLPGGCNIVAPAAYIVGGTGNIDAKYELIDRPTVVFVDDRGSAIPANARAVRLAIADKVSKDLMVKKKLTTTISPRDALALADAQDRNSDLLPIDAIGREVNAAQIIYIEMLTFTGQVQGVPRPTASCRVRVIDVANRTRLFPDPDQIEPGVMALASMREVDPELYRSSSTRLKVFEQLAEELGEEVARIFYKHEARELGRNLEAR